MEKPGLKTSRSWLPVKPVSGMVALPSRLKSWSIGIDLIADQASPYCEKGIFEHYFQLGQLTVRRRIKMTVLPAWNLLSAERLQRLCLTAYKAFEAHARS